MKTIIVMVFALLSITAYAKPRCQSFDNHNNKVTVVFTDDKTDGNYSVTDVRLIPSCMGFCKGKEYKANSVNVSVNNGEVTVTLTFDHINQFSNPKVELKINGKKSSFKVCQ